MPALYSVPDAAPLWSAATQRFDGARLRAAIIMRGWTVPEFADESGVRKSPLYRALRGERVYDKTAIAIYRALSKRERRFEDAA